MKRVIIESPYAGDIETHTKYARRCMRHSFMQGEAPLASHLLYTQEGILRDEVPADRQLGMLAGWKWLVRAEAVILYTDYGISAGMQEAVKITDQYNIPVETRMIGKNDAVTRLTTSEYVDA
jgi:hypothetical protein